MLYGSSSNACLFIACINVRQVRMHPEACCSDAVGWQAAVMEANISGPWSRVQGTRYCDQQRSLECMAG